uniref:Uncharacterized protein n=1 Tax=Syphacia muris TaxID=451379 RepID=A0A0N5AFA5_9BILA
MRTASSGRNSDQNGITNQQTVRSNNKSSGKNVSPQKGSAEMNAWLRRKDYNPMKAAAEARKLQQLKSRLFMTFYVLLLEIILFGNNLTRSRYNKSQDDLCEESCCGSRSVLATYSKGVSENLNRLKLAEKNADTSVFFFS